MFKKSMIPNLTTFKRTTPIAAAVLLAAALLSPPVSAQSGEFFFKDGDRIVVMGDSITEQHLYSNYLEMWTVTRFPKWKLTFRNVGIGGDRSTGGNSRFKRDVLAYDATALTVDFGMNDGNYKPFADASFAPYIKGQQGIADQAKAAKIRVAWITPQPTEWGPEEKGYNDTLEKFSGGLKELAQKNNGLFVDQFHPYYALMKKAREKDAKIKIMGGDAVHPGPPGQAVMAASILQGMSFPRQVCKLDVTVKDGRIDARGTLCEASAMPLPGGGFTLKRKDHALPFFPDEAKAILKFTPLLTDMNDYGFKVTGLPKGNWEIQLGGKKIAEHSADELKAGVNLAGAVLSAGPLADNVKKVVAAVKDKNKYFHDQIFRGVVLANAKSALLKDVPAKEQDGVRKMAYEERMKKMPGLDAAVRQALQQAIDTEYVMRIVPVKKD